MTWPEAVAQCSNTQLSIPRMWVSVQLLLVTETEGKLRMYSNLAGDSSAVFECPTIYPKIVDLNPASAGNRG